MGEDRSAAAADAFARLVPYVRHDTNCAWLVGGNEGCTCGCGAALHDYLLATLPAAAPAGGLSKLPTDLKVRREKLGILLRELEVIVSNYHMDGWRTRNESDANLFAEWQRTRGILFDALTDMTHEIAALRASEEPTNG